MPNKSIVWLASYPKSGNTWFRVFLSNLFSEKEEPVNINELHSTPIASSRATFDNAAGVSSSDLTFEEIENLRPSVYRELSEHVISPHFQKVHDAWKRTPSGEPLFPSDATKSVLYFIRNPLDIAVSYSFHSSSAFDKAVADINNANNAFCRKPQKLHNQLKQDLSNWSGHVKSWVDDSGLPVLVLRYEDMLNEPYREFKKAIDFLNIDVDEKQIRKAIENADFQKLKNMEEKEGFGEKPIKMKSFFREGKSGSYSAYLNKGLIEEIIRKNEAMMKRFGYA